MNKFDYITGYLPEDNTILGNKIKKTRKKSRRKVSRSINKGLFYVTTIASVATVAIIVLSYIGMGDSISASSKPALVQQKSDAVEKPIWLSMDLDDKKSTALSPKSTTNSHYDKDLDTLLNNAYSK